MSEQLVQYGKTTSGERFTWESDMKPVYEPVMQEVPTRRRYEYFIDENGDKQEREIVEETAMRQVGRRIAGWERPNVPEGALIGIVDSAGNDVTDSLHELVLSEDPAENGSGRSPETGNKKRRSDELEEVLEIRPDGSVGYAERVPVAQEKTIEQQTQLV